MASLLRVAARQQAGGNYVRQLLAAVTETEPNGPVKQALIEPLSERGLDVLRLLGTELDGPAIARRADGVPEHRPDSHQAHLRQARGDQPPRSGPPGGGTRLAANPQPVNGNPVTPDSSSTGLPERAVTRIITSITTCGDAVSPHPLLAFDQTCETFPTPPEKK